VQLVPQDPLVLVTQAQLDQLDLQVQLVPQAQLDPQVVVLQVQLDQQEPVHPHQNLKLSTVEPMWSGPNLWDINVLKLRCGVVVDPAVTDNLVVLPVVVVVVDTTLLKCSFQT
jgi:hypothetical protein